MNTSPDQRGSASTNVFAAVSLAGLALAAFLWLIVTLFEYLWLHNATGSFLALLLPLHDPHEVLMRAMFSSVLVLTGIIVGGVIQRLLVHQQETARMAENLRITLHSIGDAVITTDATGCITRMNPIAEALTGWTNQEAESKPLIEVFRIVNAQTRQPAFNPVRHVLESGQIVGLANDTLLLARDGHEHQIADSAAPIRGSDGITTGVVLVFRNVTEEYRIRREMEQINTLLKAVFEQSHIPMVMATAPDNCIRLVNQACLDFLGIPNENYVNQSLHAIPWTWKCFSADGQYLPPEETPIAKALRGEITHGLELKIEDKDGNVRYTVAEGVPIRDKEGTVTAGLVVFPDTTERKLMEEERKKLQKLESIGTLAGGIAHDFNNILMGVFGGIELAKLTLPKEHASYPYIETAQQALERATHLTKQLLTFAKGGDPLLESIQLSELIRDAIQFNLSGSNVKAHVDLADGLWPVRADKGQLSHVLANLIINAKQAMPDGGNLFILAENVPKGEEHGALRDGDYVKICLRDEGVGISEKFLGKIFDPYFSTKQSGSGLGLAIVYSIINKHDGHIRVESTPDVGSTFTLFLPRDKEYVDSQEQLRPSIVAQSLMQGRVLVMDDEPMVRGMASDMLRLLGYEATEASCGEEAVELYQTALTSAAPFCCVIMDLTIPGRMGGKEAVQKLLALDPSVRAIVASGYSTDPVMAVYGEYGFRGRLAKPYQLNDLRQELSRVLGS
jgi:PAS domain S-box-containing protein